MNNLTKTFIKLVSASIVSIAALTVVVSASAEGFGSTRSGLTQDVEGSWRGTFVTDDVNTYANTFNEPYYYSVFVNGKTTKVTAKDAYRNNYKWTSVTLTGTDGKEYRGMAAISDANKQTLTVTAPYSGKIKRGFYYAFMHNSDDSNSEIMVSSSIEVLLS